MWKLQFTTYTQIACVVTYFFKQYIHECLKEIVRGVTTLVVLAMGLLYTFHGYDYMANYYMKVHPWLPYPLVPAWEVLNHGLPLLLVGTPHRWWAYAIGYAIIITWYMMFRHDMDFKYIKEFRFDDVMLLLCVFVMLYTLMQYMIQHKQRQKQLHQSA